MSEAPTPLRIAVAGATGIVGRGLCDRLKDRAAIRALSTRAAPAGDAAAPTASGAGVTGYGVDLLSVADTEVALAGTKVAVYLARASKAPARLVQAGLAELEWAMADSFARAAKKVGAIRVVTAAREGDPMAAVRLAALQASGVPVLQVMAKGSLDETVTQLARAVEEGGAPAAVAKSESVNDDEAPALSAQAHDEAVVFSSQLFSLPSGWTAVQAVEAYLRFASQKFPLVRFTRTGDTFTCQVAGLAMLKLRLLPQSDAGVATLLVCGGLLADMARGIDAGRFEFRALEGPQRRLLIILSGFRPSLPWGLFRISQALAHAVVMRRFGRWLETAEASTP